VGGTHTYGLAPHEAAARLYQWGLNALRKGRTISPLALLAGQFHSLVIWVLRGKVRYRFKGEDPFLGVTYRVEKRPQTVQLGDDTNQDAIVHDRQAATFSLQQQAYGLSHINIGTDRYDVFRHALLDWSRRQLIRNFAFSQRSGG